MRSGRRRALVLVLLAGALVQLGQAGSIHAKAWLAQRLLERAWAASAGTAASVPPWPWADTWPVARLRLPGATEPLIVLAGASGRTLAFAPGHLHGTAAPGAGGVCLIAGHRDTHFRDLDAVTVGEVVEVEDRRSRTWRYRVTAAEVVAADDAAAVLDGDGAELVLLTCWPLGGVTADPERRFAVRARLLG